MKITQFANLSTLKIAALSTLAMGAAATISAAPASAVVITSGVLSFNDGAVNQTGSIPGGFTALLNGGGFAILTEASGGFATLFPALNPPKAVTPDTVALTYNGGNSYTSTDSLVFDFGTAGRLTIASGNLFTSVAASQPSATTFSLVGTAGTYTTTDSAVTSLNINNLDFTVENTSGRTVGSYSISASAAAVPEPFTIIGTIVGGTAAFRMKKKLAK
jgi:hypothetical protein